jgi:uncharacterized protein YkwD
MLPRHTHTAATRPARHRGRVRALLLTVAMFLGVFAGATVAASPASATIPPRTAMENEIAWVIKTMINTERALHGVAPVHMVHSLRRSARRHNFHMATQNEMSHQLPGEPYFGQRMLNAGYNWNYAGENIAWNSDMTQAGVVLLESLMYHEKAPYNDHRLNILSTHYRNVGVDVYMDKVNHKVWLTTDFGRH